jgi:hypothetical protein
MFGPDTISNYGVVYVDINPPPAPPLKGDMWFQPEDAILYIFTEDGWVAAAGGGATGQSGVNKLLAGGGIALTPENGQGDVQVASTAVLKFFTSTGEMLPINLNP